MLVAALVVPWASEAQTLGEYTFSTGTDATLWVDMSSATVLPWTTSGDYGLTGVHNIGFNFPFAEDVYTQYSVNADGNLKLGGTVTGTSNYSSPFSSTNANSNNPKINVFGCDGYAESTHYVKALTRGDTLLVVEICVGTFTSTTRSNLYKWQVQLHVNGNIDIVYPSAAGIPGTAPAVSRQCGLCVNASDGWTISASHVATHFTAGTSTTIATGTWPDANRYYRFVRPVISCPAPMNLQASASQTEATISWTPAGTESEWEVTVNGTPTIVYDTFLTLTTLAPNTNYEYTVRAICGTDDTSNVRSGSFRTPCVALSQLPYSNDFEDDPYYLSGTTSYAEALPNCWARINDATGTYNYYPYLTTTANYVHSGSVGMYWYHSTSTTYANNEYAILPPVDLDVYDMSDLILAFYAKTTSTSYHPQPIVGVMTDPTDATTFTPVYTFSATEITTDWQLFSVSFANYTDTGAYIAIKWPRPSSTCYMGIDDIFLTDDWCNVPMNVEATAALDALTVSWSPNGGTSFTVFCGNDTVTGITDTFYTFQNLLSSTLYNIGVSTECTSSSSMFITSSARTLCGLISSLPYSYGFEDMATGSSTVRPDIPCWEHLNNGSSYFGYPYASSTSPHSGTRNLYWYLSTTTGTYGDYELVVLPEVDTNIYPINTLQLSFWVRPTQTSYNCVFQVGVMTDPTNVSTFQQVQSFTVTGTTTWQQLTAFLGNYTGSGSYIAVRANRPSSSWYAYTDDFVIDLMPTCPGITDLAAVTTTSSALLTWNYQDGFSQPDGYSITYDTLGSTGTPMTATSTNNYITLTGLTTGATYKVVVRADCGAGDLGLADSITFTVSMPTFIQVGNGTSTNYELPLNNYYNYSYTQQLVTASEMGNAPATLTGIDFQYAYSSPSTAKSSGVTIYMANTTTSSLASSFVPYNSSTFQAVYSGNLNCTQGWNHFQFTTPFNYNGTGNLLIAVVDNAGDYDGNSYTFYTHTASNMAHHDYNDDDPYSITSYSSVGDDESLNYRANMKLYYTSSSTADCVAPAVLVSNVESSSVELIWAPGNDETSWDVDYRVAGTTAWTSAATGVSTTSYTVSGLTPATNYEFRVGFTCSSSSSDYYTVVTASTLCEAISLPYMQNFDAVATHTSTSVYGVMPNCWDYVLTGSSSYTTGTYLPGVYYSTTNANSGSYSLRLAGKGYFTLPPLATSLDSVMLTMNVYIASSNYNVVVGVMEDNGTFVPIDTANVVTSQHTPNEISFAGYTGNSHTIAFHNYYSTNDYSYVYIDDIVIDYLPDCPRIEGVTTRNVGQTDVTVAWTPATSGSYEVSYGPAGFTPSDTSVVAATADSIVLTGLSPNTPYDVYVREVCTGGGYGAWSFVHSFRTDCGAISLLPYIESFEGLPVGASSNLDCGVPCWGRLDNATQYHFGYVGNPSSWPSGGHTGTGFLYYYMPTTTGTYADWILTILPSIDTDTYPMADLQVSFWVKMNSASTVGDIQVGVISDVTDQSTFVPVDTVHVAGNVYDLKTAYLSGFTGSGSNIALKFFRDPSTTTYYFLDDVTVEEIPDCPPVSNIVLAGLDSNYITVAWQENGDATSWDIEYGPAGYTFGTGTALTATDDSITISGLTPNTSYDVYVTPVCTSGTSATRMGTFRTANTYIQLPFYCDFEDTAQSNLWVFDNGSQTNKWYIGSATSNGGTHAMYISDNNGASNSYTISSSTVAFAYVDVMAGAPGDYSYTFDWKCYGESSLDYIRAVLAPASQSFTPGTLPSGLSSTGTPAGWISLDGGSYLNQNGSWQTRTGNVSIPSAGVYHLLFVFRCDGSVGTMPPAAIDNVALSRLSCSQPIVSLDSVSETTADISWTEVGTATSWEYQLDSDTPVIVTDTFVTITSLAANTPHTFRVRSICDVDDTSFWANLNFRTSCGLLTVLPYFENFDGMSASTATSSVPAGYQPACWDFYNDGTRTSYQYSPYVYNSSTYAHSGSNCIRFYSYTTSGDSSQYLILPEVDSSVYPVSSLQMSFWLRGYSTSSSYHNDVIVGVMTNPLVESSFIPYDTIISSTTTYTYYEVMFDQYTGPNGRITLMFPKPTASSSYEYGYLDDLTLEPMPDCPGVSDIHLAGLDSNMLTVAWTENGSATSWDIEYGPAGFTLGTGTTVVANTDSITITGLSANTTYDVYITPVCTLGTSATRMGSFRTANTYVALPFTCDFENTTQNNLWTLENGTLTNKWYIGTATNNGGTHAMYISNDNGTSNSYTISSSTLVYSFVDVMISAPGDYAYSFDWKCQGESTLDYIRAALVPASETLTAATSLPTGLNSSSLPAGWISLDGNSKLNLHGTWQTRSDVISIASAGVYHFVFLFRCDGSVGTMPPAAIDNVMLAHMTCSRPQNITLSNLTQTSVDVSWTEPGTATSWEYQVGSGTPVVVNDTTCSLTGLTANTAYTFRVRSICGAGDTSFWLTYNFRTPCSYITIPYTQTFESETTGSSSSATFANCMTRLNNGTSNFGYPYVSSSSTYNHTTGGNKGLYWYNNTTTGTYGDYQYVILPPVDVTSDTITSLQLTFWAKASSTSYSPVFQVGVMTNPNDTAITVLGTVNVSGTDWREYSVPLATYTGTGEYVAIRALRPASSWYAYVDDITLEVAPTCLRVDNVHSVASTTTSIDIDWTDVTPATSWQVRYGLTATSMTTVTASSHPYTISGLDQMTPYFIEVRPICSVGDTGNWSFTVSLATATCDGSVEATTGPATGTGYYTPLNNYYNYTLTETIIDSAELAGIGEISVIAYEYAYSSASTEKTNVTIWLQPTNKSSFTGSSDMVALNPATAVQVYSGNLNCSQGWNYFALDTNYTWDGHSNLLVIVDDNSGEYDGSSYVFSTSSCSGYKTIYWYSDSDNPNPTSVSSWSGNSSYAQYRATMKLISCGNATCPAPVIVSTTHDHTNATINVSGSGGNSYELSYGTDPAALTGTMINPTGTFSLTGLQPNTQYFFEVVQHCDSGLVSNPAYGTFTTDDMPCFTPDSLTVVSTSFSMVELTWRSLGNATKWVVELNGAGNQRFDTVTAHPYMARNLYSDQQYTASVRAICLLGIVESEWSDTITFRTDACTPVTNVTIASVTENSAIVLWNPVDGAQGFRVSYGDSNFYDNEARVVDVPAASNSYTITGLESDSPYEVYIQTKCGDDLFSAVSAEDRISFRTLPGGTPEGIDDVDNNSLILFPNPASSSVTLTVDGFNGEAMVEVVDMNGRTVAKQSTLNRQLVLDVSSMAQGAYFVRVTGDSRTAVRKLIVR